jgi:hypothetical protein
MYRVRLRPRQLRRTNLSRRRARQASLTWTAQPRRQLLLVQR